MGIEIDYCPQCRGIWLDRGEMEKLIAKIREEESLIEQASQANPVPMAEPRPQPGVPPVPPAGDPRYNQPYDQRGRYDDRDRYEDRDKYDKKYRKDYDDDVYYRDKHGNLRKRSLFERIIDAID
ncbi:hypothetical protein CCB81_01330 [Armatimonadetes bacterium Uphvl-Ar2]|nr:hypothetical protein CCB81_01330 [Armatimonadetes bacterium Uphvl-Ar2]